MRREPIARGPAHHRGERVDVRARAQLPGPGVGLVPEDARPFAEALQQLEQAAAARVQQALVEEGVGRGEDDAAVHVVLPLLEGLVPDAHGAHAPVAREPLLDPLAERGLEADPVHGLQMSVGADDEVADVRQEALHRAGGSEPVQRLDREVRVARPAVAIVPVPPALGRLGNRAGERRHDRARLLEVTELERDRGADHLLLPLERDRERARPVRPVVARALVEVARDRGDGPAEALVGPEDQIERALDPEGRGARTRR